MAERLVDVLDRNGLIIHVYPITLDEPDEAASEELFKVKALEAAASGQVVPDAELSGLTARMHVSQAGRLQPYGDDIRTDSETKLGLEQAVRERAYYLWEQEGRPEGKESEYWDRALDQHLRERAYVLWQQQGSREGGADKDWSQLREFQAR